MSPGNRPLVLALAALCALGALPGCAGSRVCGGLARRICKQTAVSCPPLEAALRKRTTDSCRHGNEALDKVARFPPDLQRELAQGVAARLLGLSRELETIQKAVAKVQSLLVAASHNRSTEDDEAALVALGPLTCVVLVPAYETGPTAGKDPLRRVMAVVLRRDLGESAEPWRQQCYEVIAERAPALVLLGLKP